MIAAPPAEGEALILRLEAERLIAEGDRLGAGDVLAGKLPFDPGFQHAMYLRGTLLQEIGKLKGAVMCFREVLTWPNETVLPTDYGLQELALLEIARIYARLGRLENAENYYDLGNRRGPYSERYLLEGAWTDLLNNQERLVRKNLKGLKGWHAGQEALDAVARAQIDTARGKPISRIQMDRFLAEADDRRHSLHGALAADDASLALPNKVRRTLHRAQENGVASSFLRLAMLEGELAQADSALEGPLREEWIERLTTERDALRGDLDRVTREAIQTQIDDIDAWVSFVEDYLNGLALQPPPGFPMPDVQE